MIEATIHLKTLHQDDQEYGSNDEYMVSRVVFDLVIETRWYRNLTADLKQVVGSKFDDPAIEVYPPTGYSGPFNQKAFQDIVQRYFLSLVGEGGSIFGFSNCQNARMQGIRFNNLHSESFEIDDNSSGGW